MSDLPDGWEYARLADIIGTDGYFSDGDWVESKDQDPQGTVRLIQLADVGDGYFRNRSKRWLTPEKAKELRCSFLQQGDILVARMPEPLGRACIYPGSNNQAVTVVDVCIIRPGSLGVEPNWLMWCINSPSIREQITQMQTGTTRKRVSRSNLSKIHLPVPPLAEQRRIVETLEDHLSRIDAGTSFIETSSKRIDLLKQSILNDLFPPQEAINVVKVGDLIASSKGGWSRSRNHSVPPNSGVPYLKMQNITADGHLNLSDTTWVLAGDEERQKYSLKIGDVLFNNKNSAELVGKTALVDSSVAGWVFNENITRIRLQSHILPEFFVRQLNSPRFKHILTSMMSASTNVAAVYMRDLRSAPFWLPDIETQQRVIDQFKTIDPLIKSARETLEKSKRERDQLRRSLLTEAFAGRLVAQNPNDEPASALLNRIKAQNRITTKKNQTRNNVQIEEVSPVQETLL
jgi:type I restriction enzyme S subunit